MRKKSTFASFSRSILRFHLCLVLPEETQISRLSLPSLFKPYIHKFAGLILKMLALIIYDTHNMYANNT